MAQENEDETGGSDKLSGKTRNSNYQSQEVKQVFFLLFFVSQILLNKPRIFNCYEISSLPL